MRLTALTMREAPTSASLRRGIGVGPAWASCPVTVISYQRMPCTPWTTPMVLFSASRIGPCSIWASKKARDGPAAASAVAGIADALQLLAHGLAVDDPCAARP